LEDRVTVICDESRIKIAYCDQHMYDSSEPSNNEDEGVMSFVETLDNNDDDEAPHSRIWS
jgi:hypothetical protein